MWTRKSLFYPVVVLRKHVIKELKVIKCKKVNAYAT